MTHREERDLEPNPYQMGLSAGLCTGAGVYFARVWHLQLKQVVIISDYFNYPCRIGDIFPDD